MPTLSLYLGFSEISCAIAPSASTVSLLDDNSPLSIFRYPYIYSESLFAASFTREVFIRDVLQLAAKNLKFSLTDVEINLCSIQGEDYLNISNIRSSKNLAQLLHEDTIFVHSHLLAFKDSFFSFVPLDSYFKMPEFYANSEIYPCQLYTDSVDIMHSDQFLRDMLNSIDIKVNTKTVVLTGDRFSQKNSIHQQYLLAFDILKSPGFYNIKLDKSNSFIHNANLAQTNYAYVNLGTLINAPGNAECLFKSDLGYSQLVEIPEDSLFILPLDSVSKSEVLLKYADKTVTETVYGGELGVVIDTRNKQKNVKFKEVYIQPIVQSTNRL